MRCGSFPRSPLRLLGGFVFLSLFAPSTASALTVLDVDRQLPQCAGAFTQTEIDTLVRATEDPRESFERKRLTRLTLVEISPYQECQSKVWRLSRGRLAKTAAPSWLDTLDSETAETPDPSRRGDLNTPYRGGRKAAHLGGNTLAAGGVEDYQGETTIAVHPTNPSRLVGGANSWYRDPTPACISPAGSSKTYGTQALYGSTDGGKTWIYNCAPWPPQVTGGVPGAVAYFGSDPALAWDANGNAYAVYMLVSANNNDEATSAIVVAKSTDSGASWANHGVIVNTITDKLKFQDKELIAIDTTSGGAYSHPGRLYVIWDESKLTSGGGLISQTERVAYSDDGIAWTIVPLGGTGIQIGGQVVVGPDGTVYAAWNRVYPPDALGHAAGDDTYWSKSTDGGQTWAAPTKILDHTMASFQFYYTPAAQNERNPNSFVSLDVNRNPQSPYYGRLHMAWPDITTTCCPLNDFSQIDVYSSYSTDGGSTWSTRLKVNDDTTGTTHIFPWLSVDGSDGTVSVVWYDTRNDSGHDGNAQIFAARSSNGGVSWESNLQITDNGTQFPNSINYCNENTLTNPDANPNQYGDYLGVVAANRKIVALWADSRTYYPFEPANDDRVEDAAAAIVTHCSAPSWFTVFGPPPPAPTAAQVSVGAPVLITWGNVTTWGINGNGGSYTISRHSGANCVGLGTVILSNTSLLSTNNSPASSGTYSYRIRAKNNCPGTALTPMSASVCTNAVNYVKP